MDKKQPRVIITVGRQFGSGGRQLGKLLAQRLGIAYYDKEILSRAAEGSGVAEEILAANDEREPQFLGSVLQFSMGFQPMTWYQMPSSISPDSIYSKQSEAIRTLADSGSCVIVGRTADYILRDRDNVVSLFVHAPMESCVDRIVSRGDVTDRTKAKALAQRTNKLRSSFYNFYTEKRWGDAATYDLTFDTSKMPMDEIVEVVIEYINRRFGEQNAN